MRSKKGIWHMIEAPVLGVTTMLLSVACFIIGLWVIAVLVRILLG